MLVLHAARGLAVLDYRKRLLGGAVIAVVGLGTALLFRKPPEEPRSVSWPSGFTEVQPSAPLANPAPPEPVQPRLAGRIESLAENNQALSTSPADLFQRGASSYSLPAGNVDPQYGNSSSNAATSPAQAYSLAELTPLVPTNPAPANFVEPAKLDPAQQSAATSLATATPTAAEHSSGYRWSPNRSNVDPLAANENTSLAARPSLLAPPPLNTLPTASPNPIPAPATLAAAPATGYPLPSGDSTPSLSMPSYGYAPAPLLSSTPTNGPQLAAGMRHRIVDGDTLGTIARRYYGDEQRARELFEVNRQVLRDPELLPIGTELAIPGGSPNTMASPPAAYPPMSQAVPHSNGVPPLLAPPPLEQFGPRTLAVSTSAGRGANEPVPVSAAPTAPVALSPWDQQLANAAPLQQPAPANQFFNTPAIANPPPTPAGWPPAQSGALPSNAAAAPQVGWPPQPENTTPGWPTRAWNSSESALNWVGNKVMGTASPAAPSAGSKTYLVKPLETWETLAQRFYGDPRHAATLQSANQQVPAGSKIRPGTVINVPNMPL